MLRCALLWVAFSARAAAPPDVLDFFRATAEALSLSHSEDPCFPSSARPFLDRFDPSMPGYAELRDDVEALVAVARVGSAIEIIVDDGDDRKRSLELDWVLEVEDRQPRRQVLKCTIERRGKKWAITSLEPLDFFRY